MAQIRLPRTVAGYTCPLCPHCDKEYGPEVANVGPVQCDECGKWFEVTSQTIYQSEEKLDYTGGKPDAPTKPRKRSEPAKPR